VLVHNLMQRHGLNATHIQYNEKYGQFEHGTGDLFTGIHTFSYSQQADEKDSGLSLFKQTSGMQVHEEICLRL